MRVDLFDFELPNERIALRPARPRDAARLLFVPGGGDFADKGVLDLPDLLETLGLTRGALANLASAETATGVLTAQAAARVAVQLGEGPADARHRGDLLDGNRSDHARGDLGGASFHRGGSGHGGPEDRVLGAGA